MPGSIYHDFMSHPLYLLLDIMKDVQVLKVFAKSASGIPMLKTDELRIMVENRNSYGLLTFSLSTSPAYHYLNINGTKGSIKVDFLNNAVVLHKNIGILPPTFSRTVFGTKEAINVGFNSFKASFDLIRGKFNYFNGLERLIQLFYRSILLNESTPVCGEEGLTVIRCMDKIWDELNNLNK
jgi:predicted dehydrogenase